VRKLGTAAQAMRAGCWNDRCSDTEVESEHTMTDTTTHRDDLRRITDELELEIHLAGLDARDRWRALEPQLYELEHGPGTDRAAPTARLWPGEPGAQLPSDHATVAPTETPVLPRKNLDIRWRDACMALAP